jgi:hypothetical protein
VLPKNKGHIDKLLAVEKAISEILLPIAKAARDLVAAIRLRCPIKGKFWRFAKSTSSYDASSSFVEVYSAHQILIRLLTSLDPAWRVSVRRRSKDCPLRADYIIFPPINWRTWVTAVDNVIHDSHAIALHYGWVPAIYDGQRPRTWERTWPRVPKISESLVTALSEDAEEIERTSKPALEEIRNELAGRVSRAGKPRNNVKESPRDKFIYEELQKGSSLQVIKNAVNENREWESLETVNGVSQAAKRYAGRKGLPWPVERS